VMSPSSLHARSSGMQSSKRPATLPALYLRPPSQTPAVLPPSASGNT
jgi:hypothetical protein